LYQVIHERCTTALLFSIHLNAVPSITTVLQLFLLPANPRKIQQHCFNQTKSFMMTTHERKSPLLVEMTSMLGESEEDLEESEEERQVLPFSTHLEYAKHLWSQLHLPLAVFLVNIGAISIAYVLVYTTKDVDYSDDTAQALRVTIVGGFMILATVFLMDAWVAFQGAQFFENRMMQEEEQARERIFENQMMQEEERARETEQEPRDEEGTNNKQVPSTPVDPRPTSSSNQKDFNFLDMSKSVDVMFGFESKAPCSTFLIGLLYAIFAMALWGVAISTITAVYVLVPFFDTWTSASCVWFPMSRYNNYMYSEEEFPIASLQELPKFQNLPADVQDWVKSPPEGYYDFQNETWVQPYPMSIPYVELFDGSIAFPYVQVGEYDIVDDGGVVIVGSNGSGPVKYPFDALDGGYQGVRFFGFPRTLPYYGWCGISASSNPDVIHEEVLCYGNGRVMQFPCVKGEDHNGGWSWSGSTLYFATDDSLWVAKRSDQTLSIDDSSPGHREIVLSLTSYSISHEDRDIVLEVTHSTKPEESYSAGPLTLQRSCYRPFLTVTCASLPVLMLLSFYLYQRDVPSSLVPMSVSFCLILGWILPSPWNSMVALLAASICTCLIVNKADPAGVQIQETHWKYVSTEMLVWGQYALIFSVVAKFYFAEWINTRWFELFESQEVNIGSFVMVPCFTFMVAMLNAICLNHPIFEFLAGVFAVLALVNIPAFIFDGAIGLTLPLLFLTLCFGCFGMGRMCRSSWLHTKVYCRRGWRYLRRSSDKGYEYIGNWPIDQSVAAL
jgi:hypothetical protein